MIDHTRDLFWQLNSPLVQKLAGGLTAADVMTYNVITLFTEQKVKQAKEVMRLRKFSGIPVVDAEQKLQGIISIDDIINWLEEQKYDATVAEYMSRDVVCVRPNEPIIEIMKKFKRFRYGRFPVVNGEQTLVGIITPGDVLVKLLQLFEDNMSLQSEERVTKKVKGFDTELTLDESTKKELAFQVEGGDLGKSGEASSRLKQTLAELGIYTPTFMRKVAIVSYEAEVNIVIHAYRGKMVAVITPEFCKIVFEDEGPGIADIELALQPGWSTASEHVRELGFGAGMGLCNMKRWADELMIESTPGVGTTVTAIIYNR
jgi:CBS domain-containing protein/anti-sigma regulatory factor (Ser/Thr protein kinase)